MTYKSYETYVDSRIEWIGKIPKHWSITKIKHICDTFGRIGFRGYNASDLVGEGEGAYTLGGKHIQNNKLDLSDPEYLSWKKYYESPEIMVNVGDLIITQRGTLGKTVLISEDIGPATINPSMILIKNLKCDNKYLYYYLCSHYILETINLMNTQTAVPMISQEQANNFLVINPPLNEQRQITNYLDQKTAKIDATIAKNEELIELLEEKRVALINQVVTKGLNPDVPMKDSGVEWIGGIPEHWEVDKLKKFFFIHNGSTPKDIEENWGGDICWITPADYKTSDVYINRSSRQITKVGLNSCGTTLVPKGSIIVSNRAPIGTVAIANTELCTNQGCKSLSIKKDINTKFVYYALSINEKELNKLGRGTTFMELSSYDLGTFPIPIVPLSEQETIVIYLDKEISKINETLTKIQENINLLEEYKTSLIHHVVTGKIDVRGEEI